MSIRNDWKVRFKIGANLVFVGLIVAGAALGADLGGRAAAVLGGVPVAIGSWLLVMAVVTARRSQGSNES